MNYDGKYATAQSIIKKRYEVEFDIPYNAELNDASNNHDTGLSGFRPGESGFGGSDRETMKILTVSWYVIGRNTMYYGYDDRNIKVPHRTIYYEMLY